MPFRFRTWGAERKQKIRLFKTCRTNTKPFTQVGMTSVCSFVFGHILKIATVLSSVSLKVFSQGNLHGKSLKGPQSATTSWLTQTILVLGVCFFICNSLLSNYKFKNYTTLLGVSTALRIITLTSNHLFDTITLT
jgi:hypothetical protein